MMFYMKYELELEPSMPTKKNKLTTVSPAIITWSKCSDGVIACPNVIPEILKQYCATPKITAAVIRVPGEEATYPNSTAVKLKLDVSMVRKAIFPGKGLNRNVPANPARTKAIAAADPI